MRASNTTVILGYLRPLVRLRDRCQTKSCTPLLAVLPRQVDGTAIPVYIQKTDYLQYRLSERLEPKRYREENHT